MAEECFWTKKDVKFKAAAWVGDLIVVGYLQLRLTTLELHRPRAAIGHEDRKDFVPQKLPSLHLGDIQGCGYIVRKKNGELHVEERTLGLPIQERILLLHAGLNQSLLDHSYEHQECCLVSPVAGLGFGISASRLGLQDTGLISYGEMLDQRRLITEAVSISVIGDGDNGYGNAMNVKRTVKGFIKTGFVGILLKYQVHFSIST
ncbi:phosphoenolpyruvate carboxylase family protein [Tanacetum coccineum]|uniref:Phosphoenolpyruvate carboxylase family protein n=1 Tax=Tanacetum coccineum TaxID=301880 RepID=A0ABQ5BFT5_9ASTR